MKKCHHVLRELVDFRHGSIQRAPASGATPLLEKKFNVSAQRAAPFPQIPNPPLDFLIFPLFGQLSIRLPQFCIFSET
jgi:hypothetical protein